MGGDIREESGVVQVLSAALQGTLFGGFAGAAEAAWAHPVSDPTKTSELTLQQSFKLVQRRAALFGAAAVAYIGTECMVNSWSGERVWQGTFLGGMATGGVIGIYKASPVAGFAGGVGVGLGMLVLDYNGGSFISRSERSLNKMKVLEWEKSE